MSLYYFIPEFTSVFMGALIAGFMTFAMGNKKASIHRAFVFSSLKLVWLNILGTYFSFYDYWIIFLFAGYFCIFKTLYGGNWARGIRFLFLSTVFSICARIVLAPRIYKFAAGFIY